MDDATRARSTLTSELSAAQAARRVIASKQFPREAERPIITKGLDDLIARLNAAIERAREAGR